MHKVRAKKAFTDKKAEEVAAEAKGANLSKREKLDADLIKKNPLVPVVTEEQLVASGSDPVTVMRLAEAEGGADAATALNNKSALPDGEKRYGADEAKRSIHFPYATGPQMATFFDRMRLTKRSFYYQEQGATEVKLVEPDFADTDEDAVEKARRDKPGLVEKGLFNEEEAKATNRKQRDQWYGLCRMEYLSRQQQYRKKKANTVSTLKFIVPAVVLFAAFLCVFWPLWDNLLDIETNNHFATLGLPSTATTGEVRKAYRAMAKQWHPDHNPDCGQKCRDMMMKIQEAYDKLISRGSDAEDVALQRENQLKQALQQIRNIIFFKAYSIAFFCAEFINLLVLSVPFIGAHATRRRRVETLVRVLVVVAFSAAEVILVTGFNLIIILQIFYFAVNMVTGSASKKQMEKWLKRSNFDFRKDFVFFVLPAVAFHAVYFLLFERYPKYDVFVFDCALGFAYVASHLAKFSPNLFDNWSLKKCSLTTQYMKPMLTRNGRMGLQYTAWNFWSSEFSIMMDDLFAYTSSIPAVFRLVVIGVHVCYLVQMRLLPWDAPVTGKLGQRYRKQKDAAAASSNKRQPYASSPIDFSDDEDENGDDFAERLRTQIGGVPAWRAKNKKNVRGVRALSDTEREWFTNVDATGVLWMDVPYTKYGHSLQKHSTPTIANTSTQLCLTPNLQEILVVHVNQNKQIPQQVKDPVLLEMAKAQPTQPQFRLCERFYDPEMCRLLYRDMKATIFLNPGNAPQPAAGADGGPPEIAESPVDMVYRRCGGAYGYQHADNNTVRQISILSANVACSGIRAKEAVVSFALSPDDVDYKDTDPKDNKAWRIVFSFFLLNALLVIGSLGSIYALYQLPEPSATLRNPTGGANRQSRSSAAAATAFEPFLTPVCSQKYTGLLPGDHTLNIFAAGAMVIPPIHAYDEKLPIPIFVPDLWDALRQLSLFTSSNGGGGLDAPDDFQQQQQEQFQQQQQQQQQQSKRGGGGQQKKKAKSS